MECNELIIIIEERMEKVGTNWRQHEISFEGKVTRSLKRKLMFNIVKLNEMLEGLGLEVGIKNKKK